MMAEQQKRRTVARLTDKSKTVRRAAIASAMRTMMRERRNRHGSR